MFQAEKKVKQIICEQLDVKEEELGLETELVKDLGADFNDEIAILRLMACRLAASFTIDQAKEMKTIGDLVKFVEESRRS